MSIHAAPGDGQFGIDREKREDLLRQAGVYNAREILRTLEAEGYTIYRKRIFNQKRRAAHTLNCTAEIAAEIRSYALRFPDTSQLVIANVFNVNPGRVSEALNSLR